VTSPTEHDRLRALIYDRDGVLHEDVQRAVEAAIREYPNQDAPHWLGGVAAIDVVMERLGLYHDDE
jgi:hypothetical protein